ncbi:Golgin subfamily A member 7/ERF4 family-domain-containing protein [Xylaria sp. FL0933]|nr:Golgin subfamily A member 7/ERF4 family-domain-containing protein [Xylaria sp. FL0933]
MPVHEDPIPACMNSANLFLPSPLNAIIVPSSSPRTGPSHHDDSTTRQRRRHRPRSRIRAPSFVTAEALLENSSIAGVAVEAAFASAPSSQRLHTPQSDPTNSHRPPTGPAVEPAINPTRPQPHRSRHHTRQNAQQSSQPAQSNRLLPPPFRNRAARRESNDSFLRSIGPAGRRLWNPTNSTPRLPPPVYTRPSRTPRKRRPSTPPPPAFPVNHPTLDETRAVDDQIATGAGDYPLLTLPEQRQSRHPTPTRSSFQIEERLNEGKRVSLPSSVRFSYDKRRTPEAPFEEDLEAGLAELEPKSTVGVRNLATSHRGGKEGGRARATSFGLVYTQPADQPVRKVDKGKGKAVMSAPNEDNAPRGLSTDLERGPADLGQQHNRSSNLSLPSGIRSAISSSNSSIIGDPDQPGLGDEWGPQHPCFPHLNPYVPIDSPEYKTTRIIRIRRDWLLAGDLAPTFSNMYPEILDPAGISEREFRRVIEKLNGALVPIFNPYSWRNILDGVLGMLTAWLWEDFGLTNVKTKLNELEAWIDKWNAEMEKTTGSEEGAVPPKIISLRRTGYMSLDFQIANPEVSVSTSEPGSRSGPAPSELAPPSTA